MKKLFLLLAVMSMLVSAAIAQSTTGRLIGTVSGTDGLLPGATVVVTDNQTGRELTTQTDSQGSFRFEQLSFGLYTVRISQAGFKAFVANDVKIDANRDYTLNSTLEIGAVEETVTVQAGADVLNASNAELSTTVSPRQVLELPINGRNPLSLLNLQAGVNATSNSINGQRSSSQNYTRDGVNIQDNFIRTGGFVQDRPTVDDTGEFTVVTQNAGAELGGGGSTQVLLVTPRGGKDFHGALFAYNRNSAFAANTFGNNATNTKRPFLNRNQFGGKLSGPLPLPGFGEGTPLFHKDKGFFFVSYERFLLRQTSPQTRRVLLAPFRTGNFTYVDTAGVTRTVNVLNGTGLTGAIPATVGGVLTVDPVIQSRFLALTPTSGNGTILNSGLTQGLTFNQNDNDTRNGFTTRFDVDINDRNSVYFIYKYNDNKDDRQTDAGGFDVVPFGTQGGPTDLYLGTYRTVIGSNFTNEIRGAYSTSSPFFNQASNFPTDYIIGGLPLGLSSPEPSFQAQGRDTQQTTFQDNASYTVGNHSLRFGVEYNRQRIQSQTNFNQTPIFNISGTGNTQTPALAATLFPGGISATDLANARALRYLLGGIVGSGSVAANFVNPQVGPQIGASSLQRLNYSTTGLYISDQWRVTPQLTLNLGLRYDYFAPLTNPDQRYLEPDLQGAEGEDQIRAALLNPNGRYVLVGNNAGTPGQFFKGDKNNFGPVVSFAYTPNIGGFIGSLFGKENQTVIRGGFRVSYVNDEYVRSADNAAGGNAGLDRTVNAINPLTGTTSLNARFSNLPGFTLPPFAQPPISFATGNINAGNSFNTVFAIDPNLQTQQNMEYNFGIQREIGFDTAIEIRYVGGRSNSLVQGVDFNQVNINAGGFLADFIRARENCRIQAASIGRTLDQGCTNANNIGLAGQVDLPVFAALPSGGLLTNTTVLNSIAAGTAADLAVTYFTNGLAGSLPFRPNPNAGPVDLLRNGGRYRYNAMQAEIRRRFTQGLSFQANYTFQKVLSDVPSDQQTRFDPILDLAQPELEYSRADYDRTHTININGIYELPFGSGKRFLNQGGWVNRVFGGFQFTSIINISSGTPITIKDPVGTLNRAARAGRQTATSSLTADQIRDLIGIFRAPNGTIYYIDPSVIAPNGTATGSNVLGTPGSFAGQVFFRNQPGRTGNLPRAIFDGPWYFNWDAGLIKNIAVNERVRVQLRAEAFNVLNRTNFFIADNTGIFNIASTTFGQIQPSSTYSPRIMQFAARFEF
jgi:hypothetical protein